MADKVIENWWSLKIGGAWQTLSLGSKLTVASSEFATRKSHLPPAKSVGSKKLPPGNSVLKVISWKPLFTEITLLSIRQNTMPFDHMEFCLVINLITSGNRAVTWPPISATRYASFDTTLNSR